MVLVRIPFLWESIKINPQKCTNKIVEFLEFCGGFGQKESFLDVPHSYDNFSSDVMSKFHSKIVHPLLLFRNIKELLENLMFSFTIWARKLDTE